MYSRASEKAYSLLAMIELLKELNKIYYWPNNGNLGDLLIAEATRQFFRRNHIIWEEYNPSCPPDEGNIILVYGGGGRFTSHWGGIDLHLAHLTHPRVKMGIILPHSFFEVDFFLKGLDERHVIICREQRSYDYCRSLVTKATVMLDDDMGLQLAIRELPSLKPIPEMQDITNKEEHSQYELLKHGWHKKVLKGVRQSTVSTHVNGQRKKVAFLLRTDKEKTATLNSPLSYDISRAWDSSCRETAFNSYFIQVFAAALSFPDVVVTDRLHVAIMAHLCGKEVYLLDNDYGKLSGVYNQSLSGEKNVHLLPDSKLQDYLLEAWNKLNNPIKIILFKVSHKIHKMRTLPRRAINFIKRKLLSTR